LKLEVKYWFFSLLMSYVPAYPSSIIKLINSIFILFWFFLCASYPVPVNIPNIPKTKKSPQSFLRDDFLPFIKTPQIFYIIFGARVYWWKWRESNPCPR